MLCGRVGPNATEVQIERDQYTLFSLRAMSSAPARRLSATVSASKPELRRRTAQSDGRFSSIFSFKPNVPREGPPYPRAPVPPRCESCLNIGFLEGRITLQELFVRYAGRQVIQNHRNHDTRSADSGRGESGLWERRRPRRPCARPVVSIRQACVRPW